MEGQMDENVCEKRRSEGRKGGREGGREKGVKGLTGKAP